MQIIDARVRVPQAGRESSKYAAPERQTEQYDRVLDLSEKMNAGTLESLLESMESQGISKAVMHAETEGNEDIDALNNSLFKILEQHSDKFLGVGAVDIYGGSPGTASIQVRDASDRGLVGVSMQPSFAGLDIDSRLLYPAYARAEELEMVVFLHTGINYSRMHPIRHERPELLDQVACDFPNLKLVACHAGWPYAAEFCAVARRHPTVYLEFGGLAPKYVAKSGAGWDTVHSLMDNVLQRQVLFGSDWPVMDLGRVVEEWNASGLSSETLSRLFGKNSAELFALPIE